MPLPPAALELVRGADVLVHAGDVMTADALEALRAIGPPLVAVAGNVDHPGLGLPEVAEVPLPGGRTLVVVHDAGPARGRAARMARRFPAADVVVFGHSHIPLVEEGPPRLVNPGSATRRRRQPHHTMALLDGATLRVEPVVLG